MSDYRFIPEKYAGKSSRHTCPRCHKKHQFTRYVDTRSNEYIHDDVGICNRSVKCGYHYPPKQYFQDLKHNTINPKVTAKPKKLIKTNKTNQKYSYLKYNNVISTKIIKSNTFYKAFPNLHSDEFENILKLYRLGTHKNTNYLTNAPIFWQIDLENRVRTGKIIQYNAKGKRVKGQQNWYHRIYHKNSFNLKQVPFGLHLLNKHPAKKIAIVESEKTAILMSLAIPEFNWLAVGSCQNLSFNMLKLIKNKDVILFPDADKYELWKSKIPKLPKSNFYHLSELLYTYATDYEKKEDYDLADYYLRIV